MAALALSAPLGITPSAAQGTQQVESFSCGVVRPADWMNGGGLRSFASYPSTERVRDVIYKSDYIHVFRFAVAIAPSMYRSHEFRSDRNKVTEFWNNLERDLNSVFVRDCGIRFEIIRDYQLILEGDDPGDLAGTHRINATIGKDAYDVGIIIKNHNRLGGQALLGGIRSEETKAAIFSRTDWHVIAHELGHLFGADHTHNGRYGLDGLYVEPGNGRSIMSYGYPRTFFALTSITEIRESLDILGYYTDKGRTVKGTKHVASHAPYVVPLTIDKPKLKHEAIRSEYIIPEGTRYQFYIPTTEAHREGWLYNAHPYDVVKSITKTYTNLFQPSYEAISHPVVMHQPRYDFPVGNMTSVDERIEEFTNRFYKGVYTYLLSAQNKQGHHDSHKVKLRIVEGEPFKITEFTGPDASSHKAIAGETKLALKWQTSSEIYGSSSKVRILLSTDFGQTFPYILADDEPNDGSWEGVCPYIEAGLVNGEFVGRTVRGAILKLEVKGEAAYAVTHEAYYGVKDGRPVGTGGFLIEQRESVNFSPKPEPSKHYAKKSDIPEMSTLMASYNGQNQAAVGTEEQVGSSLKRTWRATVAGKTAVYTQIITWDNPTESEAEQARIILGEVERKATILYSSLGKLGYPKKSAAPSRAFVRSYEAAFTKDGKRKSGVTLAEAKALEKALADMMALPDQDIVLPIAGQKYKIANVHKPFGREYVYYLTSDRGFANTTTEDIDAAAVWDCHKVGDLYNFTHDGHDININGFNRGDMHIAIKRGYTWGTFTLIGSWEDKEPRMAYFGAEGKFPHFIEVQQKDQLDHLKTNKVGYNSTDFVFIPLGDHPTEEENPATPPVYSVQITQSEGGKVSIEGVDLNQVAEGTRLRVEVTPEEGYELISLIAGSEDITESRAFTAQGNVAVRATFALKTFKVALPSTAEGRISVEGDIDLRRVPYGMELRLVVTPSEGYRLKSLKSGSVDLTESLSLVVKTDHTLLAVWEALPKENTSVEELEAETVSIYPNPTTSVLYLRGAAQGSSYELMDLWGVVRLSGEIRGDLEVISLEALSQGMYVLRLGSKSWRVVKR